MAINTIATAAVFQQGLDKQMMEGLTSSFMDANAGQVIYDGGKEVKIPKISLSGLSDYDVDNGYPQGAVVLEYETKTMTMDRGKKFYLDSMVVNETNFVATAGTVLGEFQRTRVIPEVDAYRYSTIAKLATANKVVAIHTDKTIFGNLIDDIAWVQDKVGEGVPLVVCINGLVRGILNKSADFGKHIHVGEFRHGEVSTKVNILNEVPVIPVPSDRMFSAYKFENTKDGGFKKDTSAVQINWIVMPFSAAIGVCKQDKSKIITPEANQDADAWMIGYRKYHDLWIKDNMIQNIRVNQVA